MVISMNTLYERKKAVKWVESVFNTAYLTTVLASAGPLLFAGDLPRLFGIMALILFAGDACHLIPRVYGTWNKKGAPRALRFGKLAASLTMTVFYLVLWEIGMTHYGYSGSAAFPATVTVYLLAALRVLLCLFPQNGWFSEDPPLKWAIARNIPFTLLGIAVMALFAAGALKDRAHLSFIWLMILISFACYLPVVLWADKNPKIGMLMLPKTCAYAAIILTGFTVY